MVLENAPVLLYVWKRHENFIIMVPIKLVNCYLLSFCEIFICVFMLRIRCHVAFNSCRHDVIIIIMLKM